MFTGIVEQQAKIRKIVNGETLRVEFSTPARKILKIGASVLLNGICSTVTEFSKTKFSVEYMPETRKKTTVDTWNVGDTVHFETSLRVGDTVDGHFVFGHVDTVGKVFNVSANGKGEYDIVFTLPLKWIRYFVPKGSVAIDGVSLTVVEVRAKNFSVSLIPHTLKQTHLGNLKKGDVVNIECDMMAKYAARAINADL